MSNSDKISITIKVKDSMTMKSAVIAATHAFQGFNLAIRGYVIINRRGRNKLVDIRRK